MRERTREWLFRAVLLAVSLTFALAGAEVMVRVFYPVNDGRANVTLEGAPIKGWLEPGVIYRQVSNEYNALTTITDKGHRAPASDNNPDVIFLGDSFTYGFGLNDDETFASIYCKERHRTCANLGLPSSGTAKQLNRLEEFLGRWHWRPKEVKLFFFGMSTSLSAGNDFVDNYNYGRWFRARSQRSAVPPPGRQKGLRERLIGSQSWLLAHSHLIRRAKYHWGPLLKSALIADPGDQTMSEALAETRKELARLDAMSRRDGFDYSIYLLVPVQDLIRGTYSETLAALNSVSPKPVIETAGALLQSPREFYFAYDGHLNPKGSRRIAELLITVENERSVRAAR